MSNVDLLNERTEPSLRQLFEVGNAVVSRLQLLPFLCVLEQTSRSLLRMKQSVHPDRPHDQCLIPLSPSSSIPYSALFYCSRQNNGLEPQP